MTKSDRPWSIHQFLPHLARIRLESEKNRLIENQDEAKEILVLRRLRAELRRLPTFTRVRKRLRLRAGEDHPELQSLRDRRNAIRGQIRDRTAMDKKNPVEYIGPCPAADCRGFLRKDGSCGLCERATCSECGEEHQESHECNPDARESMRAIRGETRPCPGCSIRIFQISGCDQMWCVMCRTSFSWRTGKRLHEAIHNPHYYEWLFNHHQERIDVHCNDEIPDSMIYLAFLRSRESQHVMFFLNMHSLWVHMRHVLPRLEMNRDYRDLRVRFLVGDIDETKWEQLLLLRERKRFKTDAFYMIIDMLIHVLSDLLHGTLVQGADEDRLRLEFEAILRHAREQLDAVCAVHGGRLPVFLARTL